MLWWIGAGLVWLVSAGSILWAMTNAFSGKKAAMSEQAISLYGFHGVSALLALWLAYQAITH